MEYRSLGRTGVQVSSLCLGVMTFGGKTDQAEAIRMVDAFLEAGGNFIDTANVYGRGKSEEVLAGALEGSKRDRIFLATKVHGKMGEGPNDWGNTRVSIMKMCEDSLRRLKTDHIDLYQIHRPQSSVPIDETLRALHDLIQQGKVRYIGTSTFAAWQLVEVLWAAKELHLNRFACEQPPYNLLDRRIERELLPFCRTYGVGVIPWAPIAGGLLSGKYRLGRTRPAGARYEKGAFNHRDNDAALAAIEKYLPFCEARGVAPVQMALAWCLAQPGVTSPIIGPRTAEQMDDYLKALEITVTEEDAQALDAIFPPGTHLSNYYSADFGPNARWI